MQGPKEINSLSLSQFLPVLRRDRHDGSIMTGCAENKRLRSRGTCSPLNVMFQKIRNVVETRVRDTPYAVRRGSAVYSRQLASRFFQTNVMGLSATIPV